jgi:ComF family protein
MEGVGGKLVHLYKYQGWKALANVLALNIVASRWSDREFWDTDLLLPVPISLVRRRERGYNQSEILAEEISGLLGIPVGKGILERVSWNRPQVGLPYADRLRNVFNAFRVPDNVGDRLTGRRVILVDDVITTGATIHACYQALVKGGAGRVSCVSFGRAGNHIEY